MSKLIALVPLLALAQYASAAVPLWGQCTGPFSLRTWRFLTDGFPLYRRRSQLRWRGNYSPPLTITSTIHSELLCRQPVSCAEHRSQRPFLTLRYPTGVSGATCVYVNDWYSQ